MSLIRSFVAFFSAGERPAYKGEPCARHNVDVPEYEL